MPVFDELNLNPLIVVEDGDDGKKLPNEITPKVEPVVDQVKDDKNLLKPENQPVLATLEVEEDEEGKDKLLNATKKDTPTLQTNASSKDDNVSNDLESTRQWANYYKELNLLSPEFEVDKFEGNHEDLRDLILEEDVNRITNGIEEYKNSVPEIVRELLSHWEEGAEEESLRRVIAIKHEQVNLNKIDNKTFKEDKELQKNVLSNYLRKTTRMTDAKIQKHVERLAELDELEEESTEALEQSKVLLKQEEDYIKESTKANNIARDKQILENQTNLKNTIKGTKEIITNISVTEGEKKDIESMIFQPVGRYQNGAPQYYLQKLWDEDPAGMSVKMNYLALVTKGFTDWSKIEKKATTIAAKKIDTVFQTPPPKSMTQRPAAGDGDWKANLRSLQTKRK